MTLRETFKKQGGMNLIRQYRKSGALLTAAAQFVLLGTSRTALEILRLSAGLKTKQRLEKKYKKYLLEFDRNWKEKNYDNTLEHKSSKKIWICWFQGMENAPEIVQKCYESIRKNIPDREIILITSENLKEYVTFPDYILQKWQCGQITNTHMADLLRLELLIRYGGMWLDATVFCSEPNIPDYFFDSDLFFFQCLKPGRDGKARYISSWLISAKTNNKILMATRNLCYEYWKRNKEIADYFMLHDFMSIVLDFYRENWDAVVPRDNAAPHILLFRLFDKYDESLWRAIRLQTQFHKLTYKFKEEYANKSETYYSVIFGDKDA